MFKLMYILSKLLKRFYGFGMKNDLVFFWCLIRLVPGMHFTKQNSKGEFSATAAIVSLSILVYFCY